MKKLLFIVAILFVFSNTFSQSVDQTTNNKIRKQKGYTNITEIDFAFGEVKAIDWGTSTQYCLGIQTINGHQFSPYFYAGMGVGFMLYKDYTINPVQQSRYEDLWKGAHAETPVFLDFRINLVDFKVTPFFSLDAGYSIPYSSVFHGGYFVNPSFGVKYFISAKTALNVSVGYRHYSTSFDLSTWPKDLVVDEISNLFSVKAGFAF